MHSDERHVRRVNAYSGGAAAIMLLEDAQYVTEAKRGRSQRPDGGVSRGELARRKQR